jgi:hypothetical protein
MPDRRHQPAPLDSLRILPLEALTAQPVAEDEFGDERVMRRRPRE